VISRLPLDEQLSTFQEALSRNDVLTAVLSRSASLGLPGWYLTAGCLFQTVWNVVTGRRPALPGAGQVIARLGLWQWPALPKLSSLLEPDSPNRQCIITGRAASCQPMSPPRSVREEPPVSSATCSTTLPA
jgi:hypothetical protein